MRSHKVRRKLLWNSPHTWHWTHQGTDSPSINAPPGTDRMDHPTVVWFEAFGWRYNKDNNRAHNNPHKRFLWYRKPCESSIVPDKRWQNINWNTMKNRRDCYALVPWHNGDKNKNCDGWKMRMKPKWIRRLWLCEWKMTKRERKRSVWGYRLTTNMNYNRQFHIRKLPISFRLLDPLHFSTDRHDLTLLSLFSRFRQTFVTEELNICLSLWF